MLMQKEAATKIRTAPHVKRPACAGEIRPDGISRCCVLGLVASISRSAMRLYPIAAVRAETMHTISRKTSTQEMVVDAMRVQTRPDTNANGNAKTLWLNLIIRPNVAVRSSIVVLIAISYRTGTTSYRGEPPMCGHASVSGPSCHSPPCPTLEENATLELSHVGIAFGQFDGDQARRASRTKPTQRRHPQYLRTAPCESLQKNARRKPGESIRYHPGLVHDVNACVRCATVRSEGESESCLNHR